MEVEQRLLTPYLKYNNYGWMGLDHPNPVNNWNPWINSNMLVTYLVFSKNFSTAGDGVAKTIRSTNRFLHFYADDGGCDEGPSYFGHAGASFFDFVEELGEVTDVSYLYREEKIRNIASYIYKVYIGKIWYVNYADAAPMVREPVELLERVGKNTGDENLLGYTAHLRSAKDFVPDLTTTSGYSLYRLISNIFGAKAASSAQGSAAGKTFKAPATSWFEGIQVVTARDKADSLEGIFFSAKGGTNSESHNHNDIGNFLLFCDSTPVLVDAGVEQYTKFTFNEKRYTLWAMRSSYHNTPTINGKEQLPGLEYHAKDVSFTSAGGETKFSLDIGAAYPADTGIESYQREFVLKHGESFTVTDRYRLKECREPLVLNFLCYERPEAAAGKFILSGKLALEYDTAGFDWEVDEIPLNDPKMHGDWQKDYLYRLRLARKDRNPQGEVSLRFVRK
jgi:hypothetical protein